MTSAADPADTGVLACAQFRAKRRKTPCSFDQNLEITSLRNWHGVVPEELPLFGVERRGTTHERKRIMLAPAIEVKFKLFIMGIDC
jgi:hypothetical protein